MKIKVVCAALAMAVANLVPAQAQTPPPAAADETATLANIVLMGRTLHALDRAAWVSTDVVRAKLPKARQKEVRGWIVEPADGKLVATYYGLKPAGPYGVYSAEVTQGKVSASHEIDEAGSTLSPVQLTMIKARESVASSKIETCGAPFNTVVIPPANDKSPVQVYLLSPQTKTGVYPAGKHFRITINPDGGVSARPFTNSCLNIGAPALKAGEKPVGLMVTHLLDKTPTEIHVLLSLQSGMPVFVGTSQPDQVWQVNGSAITRANLPGK